MKTAINTIRILTAAAMIAALPACASTKKPESCPAKTEKCACHHKKGETCKPNTNPNCKAGCCTKKM